MPGERIVPGFSLQGIQKDTKTSLLDETDHESMHLSPGYKIILAFRDRSNLRNCSSTPWSQLWGYAWWARRPWVLVARHPARHPDLLAWWNGLRSYALAYVRPSSGRRLEHTLRQVERRRIRRRPEKKCDTVRLIVKKLRCVRKLCVNQWLCQDRHNYLTSKIYCRCQLWAQSV